MKSLIQLRRTNLSKLIRERYEGSHKNFQVATGISMSQVGQWLADDGDPNGRNMSERSARKIEAKSRMPDFWMDEDHALAGSAKSDAVTIQHGSAWPFSIDYYKYEMLDNHKKRQLDDKVVSFIEGALPSEPYKSAGAA